MTDWQNKLSGLSDEVSDFIFYEAKGKLASVLEDAMILDGKSSITFTALISITGLVATFHISEISGTTHFMLDFAYYQFIICFLISFFLLIIANNPKNCYGNGFKPSEILAADKYFLANKNILIKGFLIKWYNDAIKHNTRENRKRGSHINRARLVAISSLSVFIVLHIYY